MPTIMDVVRGAIKLNNLPERACFSTFEEFVEALPDYLDVEVPTSVSNVVIGPNTPSSDDKNKIWFRRDASGVFIGIYAFQNGAWQLIYTGGRGQVIWTFGDSSTVDLGYTLIQTGDTVIPAPAVLAIISQYVPNGMGGFSYYALRFSGY